jgi:PAS domain S-box-containing protein
MGTKPVAPIPSAALPVRRAQLALEGSTVGLSLLDPVRDARGAVIDFRWTWLNPRACDFFGFPMEELVGRRVTEVIPRAWEAPDVFATLTRVLATGEPAELEVRGGRRGADRWYLNHVVPLGDGVAVWFSDVTERHRTEQRLRESEARFRRLADTAPVMIWVTNHENCEFVNREFLEYTGLTLPEVLGTRWMDAMHPEDRDAYVGAFRRAVAEGSYFEAQSRFRRTDGTWRWFTSRALPVYEPDGRFAGHVGCSADIDDVKRSQVLLQEADRRKDEFLAVLAHELRNPLAPIRQAAAITAACGATPAQVAQAREIIERQVGHMALLLDDLLDVSRITRGVLELRRRDVVLDELLTGAVESARPVMERKGHRLVVDTRDRDLRLNVDPVRISQVLTNLLTNAAKFTPPGGIVGLATRVEDGCLVIEVADDGVGIAPENLKSVFGMFSQVGPALDRTEGGLGIGLALVKGIVELHGGSVEALSRGLGHGSCFIVKLPLGMGPVRPAAISGIAMHMRVEPRRILVVDDNVDAADSLAMLLQLDGHDVGVANGGPEALQRLAGFDARICILDIGMQGMNGYQLAERLREGEDPARRRLLIALTGWGQAADRARAAEAGFDHHLTKPVDLDRLRELIATSPEPSPQD